MSQEQNREIPNEVVERLRRSRQEHEYEEGHEAGQEWAEDRAEAFELERLEALHDRLQSQPIYNWKWLFSQGDSQRSYLYFEIHPENNDEHDLAEEFWDSAIGDENPNRDSKEFLRGFAEGALEVWKQVKGQL